MNELEKRLRSWTPRGPSARIEERILRRNADFRPRHPQFFHPSWLVPAAAAGLLLFAVSKPSGAVGLPSLAGPMVASIMSNQTAAAYLSTAYQPQANGVPAESFEWTNGGSLTSSITSISSRKGSYNNK